MPQTSTKAATLAWLSCAALFVLFQSFIPTVSSATTTPAPTGAAPTANATISPVPTSTTALMLPSPKPTQPTSSTGNTFGNSTIDISCPPPLIPNVFNITGGSCMGPCCIPCPASSVFYEPKRISTIYTSTSVMRVVSTVFSIVLAICYTILPSHRKHPHLIVLVLSIVSAPWTGLGTAWLYKEEELLCKSPYEIATMSNSWLCGVQGALVMYTLLILNLLSAVVIANLHIMTVYRSVFVQTHMTKVIIVSFILPFALVIPVVVLKQFEYPGFGSICLVSASGSQNFIGYPISAMVFFNVVMHVITLGFMFRNNRRANSIPSVSEDSQHDDKSMSAKQRRLQAARDISLLLKQQWRPALFSTWLLITTLAYGFFSFIEGQKLLSITPTTTWFINWLQCLGQQAMVSAQSGLLSPTSAADQLKEAGDIAQSVCAAIAAPNVPLYWWAALAEFLPASVGAVLSIIFLSKLDMWQDVRRRLSGQDEETDFVMGDITKDAKDRQQKYRDDEEEQRRREEQQQTDYNMYYSQDQLTPLPKAAAGFGSSAQYQNDLRIVTSPPPFPQSFSQVSSDSSDYIPGYGSPVRKMSHTSQNSREPIDYYSPAQSPTVTYRSIQEQQPAEQQRQINVHQQHEPWLPSHQSIAGGGLPLVGVANSGNGVGFNAGRSSSAPLSASAGGIRIVKPASYDLYE